MYRILRIDGDPATWVLREAIDAGQLTGPGDPPALQVTSPLQGTLLVSRRSASVALLGPDPVGWLPGHIMLPAPVLYLPSPAGPTTTDRGYDLPPEANLAQVQGDIAAAMSAGTVVTVTARGGVLVLNGAALPFAVLCPVSTGGGAVT